MQDSTVTLSTHMQVGYNTAGKRQNSWVGARLPDHLQDGVFIGSTGHEVPANTPVSALALPKKQQASEQQSSRALPAVLPDQDSCNYLHNRHSSISRAGWLQGKLHKVVGAPQGLQKPDAAPSHSGRPQTAAVLSNSCWETG